MDVSGNTIVLGAYTENSNATGVNGNQADNSAPSAGAAYVFARSGSSWSQLAYLKASNTETTDLFGGGVAVDSNTSTVVVGAVHEDSNATTINGNQADNSATDTGAVYAFLLPSLAYGTVSGNTSESGSSATFTVKLATQPSGNVVVNFASGDTGEGTVSPSSLTFTNANWNTNQTVTVTGVDDALVDGNMPYNVLVTINTASTVDSFYDAINPPDVAVVNVDNEVMVFSPASGTTTEAGGTTAFNVHLASAPTGNVVINLASSDTGEGTVSPSSLTFTGATWNSNQTVTLTGVDDSLIDGNTAYNLLVTVNTGSTTDSNYDLIDPPDVAMTNTDNDVASLIMVGPGGNTSETGTTTSFSMKLSSQPTGNVVVNVVSGDTAEGTVSPASLTFTNANWNTAQNVTVTGVNDFIADGPQTYAVNLTINTVSTADANYDLMATDSVNVTNNDDSDTAGYTVSAISGATTEAGGMATFNVKLNSQPLANVTVNVASSDVTEGTVSPSSLTFTSANWNSNQTVTVTGVDDFVADGNVAYLAQLTLGSTTDTTGYAVLNPPDVSVTNNDNDVVGFTVSAISGNTTEAGGTASFTVKLTSQPTNNVVVNVVSADTAEDTVSASSLTFTPANWNTNQTVTVTGVDDFMADGNQVTAIQLTINAGLTLDTSGYAATNPPDVNVTNNDNDVAGYTVSAVSGNTTEAGGTASFTVKLNTQPLGNVVINVTSSNTAEGTTSPTTLTFTGANWNSNQTVTLTGVDDFMDDGNQLYMAVLATNVGSTTDSTGYAAMNPPDVAVTNGDDDTAGFTVSAISGNTTEVGGTATFNVKLNSQPVGNVVINVTSSNTAEGTVSPATLTFTSGNWNINQIVTLTGVNDAVHDGDIGYTAVLAINGGSTTDTTGYAAMNPPDVSATNIDDDIPGFTLGAITGNTTEAGGTANFTIRLTSQPVGNVVINVTSSNVAEGIAAPAALTFTSGNWNINQVVMLTGVDEAIDDGNQVYTAVLTMNAITTTDNSGYAGLNPPDVAVTNVDNDTAGFTLSPMSGNTSEVGGNATFTMKLTSQPVGNVVINVTSSNTAEGTVAPAALTFTAANWNISQTVTVNGVDDFVDDGDMGYTAVLAINGGSTTDTTGYAAMNPPDVSLTNIDNDTVGVLVSAMSAHTTEAGGTANFTVKLNSQPTGNVVMDVASSDTTEGTAAPSSLTFTSGNWNISQTVTVNGVNDAIDDGNVGYTVLVTMNTTSTLDPLYDPINPNDVSVINDDDADTWGFTVGAMSGNTTEVGSNATFTMTLNSEPVSNVTVNVVSGDTTEGTVSPASLTFTALNWHVPHTVTVNRVDDFVQDGDISYNVTLSSSSADPNYNTKPIPSVGVTNVDNDVVGFTVSTISGATTEAGGVATFTVRLTSQPSGANVVVINVSSDDTTEGTLSPANLTFNSTTWLTPQMVTLTGVNDWVVDGNQNYTAVLINTGSTTDPLYNPLDPNDVAVVNHDNDVAGFTISAMSGHTTEAGGSATFTVKLTSEPVGEVVMDVASDTLAEGTVSPDTLIFDDTNWNINQTVTVSGVDEWVDDGNQNYTVLLTRDNMNTTDSTGYASLDPNDVSVINDDNDTAGYTIWAISDNTTEAGSTASFTMQLNSEPTGNVGVDVASSDTSEGTVSVNSLTFNSTNWNVNQTVTVTGIDDWVQDGNMAYSVVLGLNGSTTDTSGYAALNPLDVSVTNNDDDTVGFIISAISGDTTEAGDSATFTILLTSEPTGNVVIEVASSDLSEGTVSPASLTFTPNDWNITQTVTATGVDDAMDDGDQAYTLILTLNGGSSSDLSGYAALDPSDVGVINYNDDTKGFTLSKITGPTDENGTSATFSLVMQTEPTAAVNIPLASSDVSEGVISQTLLTFDATNWNIPQIVTVTGVDDVLYDPIITYAIHLGPLSSGDTDYNGFYLADVVVVNYSNDLGNPLNAPIGFTTSEDISHTFKVADFHYSDPYHQPMSGFKILLQPQNGRLTYQGAAVVSLGLYTDVTQLVYWPAPNTSGSYPNPFYYANVNVLGLASPFQPISITVLAVQDAPTSQDNVVMVGESSSYNLSASDIVVNDVDGNGSGFMQLVTLPSVGPYVGYVLSFSCQLDRSTIKAFILSSTSSKVDRVCRNSSAITLNSNNVLF